MVRSDAVKDLLEFINKFRKEDMDMVKGCKINFYYKDNFIKEKDDLERLKLVILKNALELGIGYSLLKPSECEQFYSIICSSKKFLNNLELKLKDSKYRIESKEL